MKKIDPNKLLPASVSKNQGSFSQQFLVPASKVRTRDYVKVEDDTSTPQQKQLKQQTFSLKSKLISLTKLFGEKTNIEKRKNRTKRIELEIERRRKREEEKETSKTTFNFGANLPKLTLPRVGFVDAIKRFLLYGLLGFAIDKFLPYIPALLELASKIKPAFDFFKNITGSILKGIVGFIGASYEAYDFIKKKIDDIIGPDRIEQFDNFTKNLNLVLNASIVAAAAVLSSRSPRPPRPRSNRNVVRPRPGQKLRPRVTTTGGRGLNRPNVRNPIRRPRVTTTGGRDLNRPNVRNPIRRPRVTTTGGATQKPKGFFNMIGRTLSNAPLRPPVSTVRPTPDPTPSRIPRGLRGASRAVGRGPLRLILGPFVTGVVDFVISLFLGDPIGLAAAGAIGAGIGAALGGFLGNLVLPIGGGFIGATAGGFAGDFLFREFYNKFMDEKRNNKNLNKNISSNKKNEEEEKQEQEETNTSLLPQPLAGTNYTIENLVKLALSVGFSDNNAAIAAAIAMAESSGNSNAHNTKPPDNSYGLWQINMIGNLGEARRKKFNLNDNTDLFNPTLNAQIAYKISGGSNFNAWTTYTGGAYKTYLPQSQQAIQTPSKKSTKLKPQSSLPPLPPTGTLGTGAQLYGSTVGRDGRRHAGQDFDAGPNGTFYSRIGGKVVRVLKDPGGYGNYVDIYNKELDVTERIAEGDVNLVKVGDVISPGTPVQKGTSYRGVFHYEIRRGSAETYGYNGTLNPLKYLNNLDKTLKGKEKASIAPSSPSEVASGLNEQTSYEQNNTEIVLLPIVEQIETAVSNPSGGGGITVLNSNTPSIFAPALIG